MVRRHFYHYYTIYFLINVKDSSQRTGEQRPHQQQATATQTNIGIRSSVVQTQCAQHTHTKETQENRENNKLISLIQSLNGSQMHIILVVLNRIQLKRPQISRWAVREPIE